MFKPSVLPSGHGAIHLRSTQDTSSDLARDEKSGGDGENEQDLESTTYFQVLSSCYPLKLLIPRPYSSLHTYRQLQAVYMLNYGGGLVHGDRINLTIRLDARTALLALTQGSTKVFKDPHLLTRRPSTSSSTIPPNTVTKNLTQAADTSITKQILTAHLASDSFLMILPAPVTCFRDSNYSQLQRFHLASPSSSVLILDWISSGRRHQKTTAHCHEPEHWTFKRYRSTNEFYSSSSLLIRDTLTLTPPESIDTNYSIYATLYILASPDYHPKIHALLLHFRTKTHDRQNQTLPPNRRQRRTPRRILWSFSQLEPDVDCGMDIGIVRIAGLEGIEVREWVVEQLGGLVDIVGQDLFQNAF